MEKHDRENEINVSGTWFMIYVKSYIYKKFSELSSQETT